jgi:hypothetical protein
MILRHVSYLKALISWFTLKVSGSDSDRLPHVSLQIFDSDAVTVYSRILCSELLRTP